MPAGWVETTAPAKPSAANGGVSCANYSKNDWNVALRLGELSIFSPGLPRSKNGTPPLAVLPPNFVITKEMIGRRTVVRTRDGWLVGFDAGEFGGGLWWSSVDGSTTHRLSEKNVQAMVARDDEVLVLVGLAHMGANEGEIESYQPSVSKAAEKSPGKFIRLLDLGRAPNAATLRGDGSIILAAHDRVMELTPSNQLHTLYQHDAMPSLYATSVVTDAKGNIFVGMRFYVLRLQHRPSDQYDATWFVRSACTKAKIVDYDCVCLGKGAP